MTIDHASLSRRSTVPTPHTRDLQHLGAHYVSSMCYISFFCIFHLLPVRPSAAIIYLPAQRSFSRHHLAYQDSPCHIRPCFTVCGHHLSPSTAIFFRHHLAYQDSPCHIRPCFTVCGHHLSPSTAIFFSPSSSIPSFSMSHPSISHVSSSPPLATRSVPPCTLHFTLSHY